MTGETPGINTPSLAMAEVMSGQSVRCCRCASVIWKAVALAGMMGAASGWCGRSHGCPVIAWCSVGETVSPMRPKPGAPSVDVVTDAALETQSRAQARTRLRVGCCPGSWMRERVGTGQLWRETLSDIATKLKIGFL